MSNEALTWAKLVSHEMASRYEHLEALAEDAGDKKPKNPYTGTPHAVLWVLADYANENWQCWPLHSTLARDLGGISTRTIVRALKALESLLLISKVHYTTETGARAGSVFQLHVETLKRLEQENLQMGITENGQHFGRSRKPVNECSDNLSLRRQRAIDTCGDNLSLGTQGPVDTCGDNLSLGSNNGQNGPSLSDNYDISPQVLLKERARINHHHQSSDAREEGNMIDDDDDDVRYLGVEVKKVFDAFPELDQYLDQHSVGGVIDTVLSRARTRVANPTAYVIRSLERNFYDLVLGYRSSPSVVVPTSQWTEHDVGLQPFESELPTQPQPAAIPNWDALPADAEPCINPDHWDSLAPKQFGNCPKCRIERRLGQHPRHVSSLSDDDIEKLPFPVQQWAKNARENTTAQ